MARSALGRMALWGLTGAVVIGVLAAIMLRYVVPDEIADRIWSALGATPAVAERHVIPAGYSGWLSLTYGDPDADPLPMSGDTLICRYPSSGVLRTSATLEQRWRVRSYHQVDGGATRVLATRGSERRVWREHTRRISTDDSPEPGSLETSFGFFVGTAQEHELAAAHPPGLPELPALPDRHRRDTDGEESGP